MQNKTINLIYVIGIILILVTPLLSIPPLFHPPAFAKVTVFKMIFSILLFLFVYQFLFKDKEKILKLKDLLTNKKNGVFAIVWTLLVLLLVLILSTIFSVDPRFSFFGSPFRAGGALNLIFISLFSFFAFLTLKEREWKWVWDINLIVGFVACLIALCQKFKLLGEFLLLYSDRVLSSFGGPIFFALYLILLIFLAISFGISSKGWRRIIYFALSALFLFCIFLSGTRAALIGFVVGILFFVFAFPKKNKEIKWTKIILSAFIALGLLSILFLKSQPQIVKDISKNEFFGSYFSRVWVITGDFSLNNIFSSRASGWSVILKGIKEKPLLGWGPENLSIPFDKYYDSTLPGLSNKGDDGESTWWDRGHSFIFDYAATMGIPFLLLYILFNAVIFWKLRKLSTNQNGNSQIVSHAIQATIIGYLVTNLFSFDVFDTYLIYFLIVGYALYLLTINNVQNKIDQKNVKTLSFRKPLITVLLIILIWFLWSYNIRPLKINNELNLLIHYSTQPNGSCDKIITAADKLITQHSIIDNYVRLSYVDLIGTCTIKNPTKRTEYSYKIMQLVADCIKERPTYTRNWLFQGEHAGSILSNNPDLDQKEKDRLSDLTYSSFQKIQELSPKRQFSYMGIAKLDLLLNKYDDALMQTNKCTDLSSEFSSCWWLKSLIYISKGNIEEATINLKMSFEKGIIYDEYSEDTLSKLVNVYSKEIQNTNQTKYYDIIKELFLQLISLKPENFQYHASLAYTYKMLGQYDNARQEAQKVIELSPESKASVEAFLNTLPK